jgi:accessory colonization factor AcfC
MSIRRWVLLAGLLANAVPTGAAMAEPVKVLRAYCPGGPHHVLQECAELFWQKHGVAVVVVKTPPGELAQRVREDGDLFFGGAGYMVDDFERENPGVLDMQSVQRLHPRRIGVVVRKGNPLNIKGIECLQRGDIDVLAVTLENMGEFHVAGHGRVKNVRRRVLTGLEGAKEWRSSPELDAWVTYKSWHVWLGEESEFIEIPGDHGLRYTPVALTRETSHRQEALQFIAFLNSPDARRIFVEHGWE